MLLRAEEGRGRTRRRAHRRPRPAAVLAGALALSAAAASAAAPPGRILVPREGARLSPGDVVEVAWTALPAGTEELELLLYLGDGAASVRLTEQLDPALRRFSWRVPGLPSSRARLAIRFNRGRGEEPGPESAAFQIAAPHDTEPQPVAFRDGELWAAAPFTPAWTDVPATPHSTGAPPGRGWAAAESAVLRSWHDGVGASGAPDGSPPPRTAAASAPASRPAPSRRPLDVPLRD